MKPKLVATASVWEDSDWVVSIRPETEKVWNDIPLSGVYSKAEAFLLADFLNKVLPTILTIYTNIVKQKVMELENEPMAVNLYPVLRQYIMHELDRPDTSQLQDLADHG